VDVVVAVVGMKITVIDSKAISNNNIEKIEITQTYLGQKTGNHAEMMTNTEGDSRLKTVCHTS
jgi:transposase